MATQEEINKYVEQLIQERAIEAKIEDLKPIIPPDLEPELYKEITTAFNARMELYYHHERMNRAEYIAAMKPLIATLNGLIAENEAIKARNAVKTTAANATIQTDKAALEEKQIAVKEANAEIFKEIPIADVVAPPNEEPLEP